MTKILTSDNSTLLQELATPPFQRVGLQQIVVKSGADALASIRAEKPAVAILDVALPDTTGYDVCQQLKGDPATADTRVVLHVESTATPDIITQLSASRCDEWLVTPASDETLFHKVTQLLGLPSRLRLRMAVELAAEVSADKKRWSGRVLDLNQDGARLELDRRIRKVESVTLRVRPHADAEEVAVRARVVWETGSDTQDRWLCGVQFLAPDPLVRAALMDLSLWEVAPRPDGGQQVVLQGDFREHTDFSRLAERLSGDVELDLAWVRYLNSFGVRHWVNFLRSLDQATITYHFARASVAFVTQAAMIPEALGRGQVTSFLVPYVCEDCDLEEDRLLQVAALAGNRWPPAIPDFACPRCQGDLIFDDLPERYFAFLEKDPRLQA